MQMEDEERLILQKWTKDKLIAEVERLRLDCAEAYQAVGNIADYLNYWDGDHSDNITKLMDNLSAAADGFPRVHSDLLPFSMPEKLLSVRQKSMLLRQLQDELARWDTIIESAGVLLAGNLNHKRQQFKDRAELAIAGGDMDKALVALFSPLDSDA